MGFSTIFILEILVFLEKFWYFHDFPLFHFDNSKKSNALILFNLKLFNAYSAIVCVQPSSYPFIFALN